MFHLFVYMCVTSGLCIRLPLLTALIGLQCEIQSDTLRSLTSVAIKSMSLLEIGTDLKWNMQKMGSRRLTRFQSVKLSSIFRIYCYKVSASLGRLVGLKQKAEFTKKMLSGKWKNGKKYGSGWCLTFGLLSHLFFLLSFLWDIYPHSSLLLAVTHVPEVKDAAKVKTKTRLHCNWFRLSVQSS